MKNLTLALLFTLVSLFAYSQERKIKTDAIYFEPEQKSVFTEMAKQISDQPTEIAWIKQSLNQYHKQRQTGFILQFVGVAGTTAAFFIKDEQAQKIAVAGGAALSLSGLITMLSAEKYLRAAASPIPSR
ncbi:MAG: hypothetical protein OEY01_11200 [Desulfobulbaceae bacterium]|nr:hypothetical protein [Desulfobulbaceae bacterium]